MNKIFISLIVFIIDSNYFVKITVLFNRIFVCSFLLYFGLLMQAVPIVHEKDLVATLITPEPAVPLIRDRNLDCVAVGQ